MRNTSGGDKRRRENCIQIYEDSHGYYYIYIYIFLNISLIGSIGSSVLANSPAPLATASGLISKESQSITAIIGMIAMLSAVNAYMIAGSRVLQNISSIFNLRLLRELASSGTPGHICSLYATIALLKSF
jgi:hypothetical protein